MGGCDLSSLIWGKGRDLSRPGPSNVSKPAQIILARCGEGVARFTGDGTHLIGHTYMAERGLARLRQREG